MNTFQEIAQRLSDYLSAVSGQTARVMNAVPLSGGASRETWLLDVQLGDRPQKFVLRRDLPSQMWAGALSRDQEFRVMRAAYDSGVTCARVRWSCADKSVLGSDFFIMDYVPGESIGRRIITSPDLAQARQHLPEQIAQELAKIHAIAIEQHGLDFLPRPPQGLSPAQAVINSTYALLDEMGTHNPAFEVALRWTQAHIPPTHDLTFIHGDCRIGNLLVGPQGLTAVIDWEFAHIGDPLEELGYPCMRDWRFGNGHLHFAGLCDRERFLTAYERYSGRAVDRSAVTWWEIMGNIRWGVICLSQAQRHLSGAENSVELASLGRRSVEMQLEALRLIEQEGGL